MGDGDGVVAGVVPRQPHLAGRGQFSRKTRGLRGDFRRRLWCWFRRGLRRGLRGRLRGRRRRRYRYGECQLAGPRAGVLAVLGFREPGADSELVLGVLGQPGQGLGVAGGVEVARRVGVGLVVLVYGCPHDPVVPGDGDLVPGYGGLVGGGCVHGYAGDGAGGPLGADCDHGKRGHGDGG